MNKEEKLEIKRHSLAHVMAAAVRKLYPNAKFGIGPVIASGFYYDFDLEESLTPEHLLKIEKEMKKLIKQGLDFERRELDIDEAIKLFKKAGQDYKVELLKDIKQKGTTRMGEEELAEVGKAGKKVSYYQTGDFIDLCRGPHVGNTKELSKISFKLHKLAGAYWRGDEKNKMLQRIYALAFETPAELEDYLKMLAEAEKRDHRKLGRELDLFTFNDLVGKGLPLWTPRGAIIRRELENFVVAEEIRRGYRHVYTPDLANVALYEKSGHYPYYKDTMYPEMKVDDDRLILRPMSCPHHFMLYRDKIRSYRDLPLKIAELAKLYRYEKSGELTGLLRVRGFCLADAHIFCRVEQTNKVVDEVLDLIEYLAGILGMKKKKDFWYRLSLGDRSDSKKYFKDDRAWDTAEDSLRQVLKQRKAPFAEAPGEAAFYGPKIDIQMKNVLGKEDTAFTVQYDFCLPKRFELKFINEKGQEEQPVVIHRSSIGAIERTVAFLLEKTAGVLPLWLAPVQAAIIPVGESHFEHSEKLAEELREHGLRVEVDTLNETVGNKIRKAEKMKVPYMLVIGDKETRSKNLHVRIRGEKEVVEMPKKKFIEKLEKEIREKLLNAN